MLNIQFAVPDEFVSAIKTYVTLANPANTSPSDADAVAFIASAILSGLMSLFPGVVLASQAQTLEEIAQLQASAKAAALAALNVTLLSS
jgi:hypothetical protein